MASPYEKAATSLFVTDVLYDNYNFTWTIRNFKHAVKSCMTIDSSQFPVSYRTDTLNNHFQLCIFTEGMMLSIMCNLQRRTYDFALSGLCLFSLESGQGSVIGTYWKKLSGHWASYQPLRQVALDIHSFTQEEIKFIVDNLSTDHLTIKLELRHNTRYHSSSKSPYLDKEMRIATLTSEIASLYVNGDFTDVTIDVLGSTYLAHSIILASYSTVFRTLLTQNMEENRRLVITDVEPGTFKVLLDSMYTMEEPDISDIFLAQDLYVAAAKYAVDYLKGYCRNYMWEKIDVNNALDILLLADQYNDAELKHDSLTFMSWNPDSLADESKCEIIIKKRPSLLKHIMACRMVKLPHNE